MKGRQRRQDVLILTETNSVAEDRQDTEIGYAVSPTTVEAWGLNANQQAIDGRDKSAKGDVQVICERSYKPIQVFNLEGGSTDSAIIGQNVNVISSQKEDEALSFMDRRGAKRDWQLIILGIIAGLLAITVLLKVSLGGGGLSCAPPTLMLAIIARIKNSKLTPKSTPQPSDEMEELTRTEKLKLVWSKFRSRRNGRKPQNKPNCLLFSDLHKNMTEVYIKPKYIPHDARPRDYKGHPTYLLNVSRKGKLYTISFPTKIVENESPKDLYMALNCDLEVNATYGMEGSTWEKVKFGILGVIIGIELLMLFLWESSGV